MSVANGKTKGVNERVLKGKLALETHRDRDPQQLLTPDAIRAATQRGMCSWCDRGPFKSLASHTNKAHGIDRREIRALAGLTMREPVASEDFRQRCRDRALREDRGNSESARRGLIAARSASRQYTEAGRRKLSRVAQELNAALTPEERSNRARVASAGRTDEGNKSIAAAAKRRGDEAARSGEFRKRMTTPSAVENYRRAMEARRTADGTDR